MESENDTGILRPRRVGGPTWRRTGCRFGGGSAPFQTSTKGRAGFTRPPIVIIPIGGVPSPLHVCCCIDTLIDYLVWLDTKQTRLGRIQEGMQGLDFVEGMDIQRWPAADVGEDVSALLRWPEGNRGTISRQRRVVVRMRRL